MSWVCMCPREHREITPTCPDCLHERPKLEGVNHEAIPMYRVIDADRRLAPDSKRSDLCSEPGCTKTVQQHIDELKRALRAD